MLRRIADALYSVLTPVGIKLMLAMGLVAVLILAARAQAPIFVCVGVPIQPQQGGAAPLNCQPVTATNPLPVTGTISGTISLPTGAATSALQTTGNTALSTINTTLGSPFQAGGNIGNTTFAVTNTGTFSTQSAITAASGSIASGAVASGAVASGAYASGSLASGAVVDITNMSVSTGSAPPSKSIYLGANASGATGGHVAGLTQCDSHVFKHITSATDTLAVQGVASQTIYICGWRSRAAGVATWYLENTASANANCSSSNTQITGVATEAANTGETLLSNFWSGLKNTSGNGLCINSTGTGGVDVDIWYAQF